MIGQLPHFRVILSGGQRPRPMRTGISAFRFCAARYRPISVILSERSESKDPLFWVRILRRTAPQNDRKT